MSSPNAVLSDLEDNDLLPTDDNEGYASDEAIEDKEVPKGDGETKEKDVTDPATTSRKRVQKPQPKLDAERLKNAKGIHAIEEYFEDFKFRGKGYEKDDLNKMMKKLEYWSHRLFPKFEFDDCLTKLETLGTKKAVQTHLKKIRLGMWTKADVVGNAVDIIDKDLIEDEILQQEDSVPIDEFDALIAEQLEKQRHTSVTPQRPNVSSFSSVAFNETPKRSSTAIPVRMPTPSSSSNATEQVEITEEMKERIERNRQLALQKKLAISSEMQERIERNRQLAIQKRLARIEAEEAKKKEIFKENEEDTPMPDADENTNDKKLPEEKEENKKDNPTPDAVKEISETNLPEESILAD